jgi:regulator of RNase E activity RraA
MAAQFWKSEEELFKLVREELFTAVVGDVMDKMGLMHQFLPPQIQSLCDDMIVVGRAMTVLQADVFVETSESAVNEVMKKPFGLLLEALDDLKPNEVYVCTGASPYYALWGELMSTRAMKLGAAGAILNGYSRDTKAILELNFPTFSRGRYAQDLTPRGKVIDFRVPVEIEGVRINSGDIVFGDIDGVCVVPAEACDEVFSKALEKARGEQTVKKAIENGVSATEVFATYGIL